jgi:hypothetical protein
MISAAAGAVLTLVLTVPLLARLFQVAHPDLLLLLLALAVAGASGGWFGIARSVASWAKAMRAAPS